MEDEDVIAGSVHRDVTRSLRGELARERVRRARAEYNLASIRLEKAKLQEFLHDEDIEIPLSAEAAKRWLERKRSEGDEP